MPIDLEELKALQPKPRHHPANPANASEEAKNAVQNGMDPRREPYPATPGNTRQTPATQKGEGEGCRELPGLAGDCREAYPAVLTPVQDDTKPLSTPHLPGLPGRVGLVSEEKRGGEEGWHRLYRHAWELVEQLRAVDWERAGEWGKRLNRSPLEAVPTLLEALREEVRRAYSQAPTGA